MDGSHFMQRPHPEAVDDAWHVLDIGNALNVLYWAKFFEMVSDLDFDSIVECGVGRGRSLITIMSLNLVQRNSSGLPVAPRKVVALDSFAGFPEPHSFDFSHRQPTKGEWARSPSGKYEYSPRFIKNVVANAGLGNHLSLLTLVPGFFNETCSRTQTGKIGILHLDGDLYESTRTPLIEFGPSVCPGGIIVIDDFSLEDDPDTDDFPGCRLAVHEFLQRHADFGMFKSMRGTPYLIRRG